jgi:excinuclease ABC subunit C
MGEFTVASLVCFRDGEPSPRDYRHFRLRTVTGIDDFASVREVVARRFGRLLAEARPLPDLVVIDGGAGQLAAAYEVLVRLRVDERVPVISLAKREEELYTTAATRPVQLARHEPALRLLQALRDEAHRFAITYNRELRRRRIAESVLDEIPGIGAKRKQELLTAFGSVRALRRQTAAGIVRRVPGVGRKLAEDIVAQLGGADRGGTAVGGDEGQGG